LSFRANAVGLTLAGAGLTLLGAVALLVLPGTMCAPPGTLVCEADIATAVAVAWGLGILTGVAGAVLVVVDRTRSGRSGARATAPAPAADPGVPQAGLRRREPVPEPDAPEAAPSAPPGASGQAAPRNGGRRLPEASNGHRSQGGQPARGPAVRVAADDRGERNTVRGTAPAGVPGGDLRKRTSPGGVRKRTR